MHHADKGYNTLKHYASLTGLGSLCGLGLMSMFVNDVCTRHSPHDVCGHTSHGLYARIYILFSHHFCFIWVHRDLVNLYERSPITVDGGGVLYQ